MKVFDNTSLKFLTFLAIFFALGVAIHAFHDWNAASASPILPIRPTGAYTLYLINSILDEVGSAFLITSLTGVFFELTLRRNFLEIIRNYIDESRIRGEISEVRMARTEFDDEMISEFRKIKRGQELLLIGTSQRLIFSDKPGPSTIAEKVASGARMRMLLIHPESSLIPCIENLSKDFGFPNLKNSLQEVFEGSIGTVFKKLAEERNIAGSIEIRLMRDLFSPLSIHIGPRYAAAGLYFSHESGTKCPVIMCEVGPMRDQLVEHFEKLWKESEGDVLLAVSARKKKFNIHELSE